LGLLGDALFVLIAYYVISQPEQIAEELLTLLIWCSR
jgi:hypothetical protein